ncbi:hypothetical protein UA08_03799 [Talaromyces atroroseus]|uniref:Tetrapyrrole biosynthesis uroporphyrinogen III synthase domain-containing protein n=1 Tax=Talaromyces atroroseus TaxID=1441469 RepID=A0A225B2A4_TALAT|nr:hypothetical protein UA08_03799 [Talaromyces atroroseus]OKL60955.1 hypothetical protein UA08_03799 [Talaromyces atroroseus]
MQIDVAEPVISMQSSNASSDWNFTAVIDLLHTPTRPINATSSEHNKEPSRTPQDTLGGQCLGDFTRLWDFLHPSTMLPELPGGNVSTTKVRDEPSSGLPSRPLSILKRPTETDVSGNSADVLSDSTAVESDGDLSVFDSVVSNNSTLSFIPSQVNHGGKGRVHTVLTPPSSYEEDSTLPSLIPKKIITTTTKHTGRPGYKSAVERKAGLVFKLSKQFPDFSIYTPPPTSKYSKAPSKVHVFVDLSNISIGLHDSYKTQHGIPVSTHIKRLPLSFHNFSLILERGRPVAKRVLAGSDRFAAINEAETLGYEVNILSRVHKAKEWTPRQLKFRNTLVPGGGGSEMGSSSERWVEQCVDEILHLKMLESLVDTDKPATIVLATGDAAEAEFSGGFLRMVERALQKGWSIELVSFAMNTSFAYKRKEFRAKWGARFRMINLEEIEEKAEPKMSSCEEKQGTTPPPVFLLKTPSTPKDVYEEYFRTQSFPSRRPDGDCAANHKYDPIFVPVLSHRFHAQNLGVLKSYFLTSISMTSDTRGENNNNTENYSNAFSGQAKKYGGMIFTSQRAVEAFGHILEQADSIFTDITTSTSKDMILYTVGPATTRTLTPIRDKYLPFATICGDESGNGETLAHFILKHYNERYNNATTTVRPKPGLLFLVGEQRRDIIPKTLMGEGEDHLDEKRQIHVDELVVYETAEREGFEGAFREAVVEKQLQDRQRQRMWTVIFSPTGCDAVLRTVNEASGDDGSTTGSKRKCLIATIGPTTRDYLVKNYGFEPDVVARKPSPEGIGEGILEYLLNNE